MSNAEGLQQQLYEASDRLSENQQTRLHRAISWIRRAEQEEDDPDAAFIFHWIAFNAAYAQEFSQEQTERATFAQFLQTLTAADPGQRLHAMLFERFSGPIRTLIDNKFVFEPFWRAMREHDSTDGWKRKFDADKKMALQNLMDNRTAETLRIVLDRLYVLRNQLLHGGATWNSSVNRQQVRDGAAIMASLVPIITELMIAAEDGRDVPIAYPVVR
ncbi:HEPN domain-containing protein [Methylonatrum kenyense]|uniref:HEPN domain-containing protein n=1 Tax=Methylonatrum kenyense TaxID=455253 RepID=UPI0020BFC487|nr:HEPN domain-containing protein [Methylonatrum kenyense]